MRISFIGDVHAEFTTLNRILENNILTDVFIQVGDMGAGFGDLQQIKTTKPVLFCHGNHDNVSLLRTPQLNPWDHNLRFIDNGSSVQIANRMFLFFGGGISIDKERRIEGVSWWPEEIPSHEEMDNFVDLIDRARPHSGVAMISHTCPEFLVGKIHSHRMGHIDPVQNFFQFLWADGFRPKKWVFGHHHKAWSEVIDGTEFSCIPCATTYKLKHIEL